MVVILLNARLPTSASMIDFEHGKPPEFPA
jgi:hypothetical protein